MALTQSKRRRRSNYVFYLVALVIFSPEEQEPLLLQGENTFTQYRFLYKPTGYVWSSKPSTELCHFTLGKGTCLLDQKEVGFCTPKLALAQKNNNNQSLLSDSKFALKNGSEHLLIWMEQRTNYSYSNNNERHSFRV
ncbi:hypothetical protein TNCV_4366651 [Trichonephila clavipes]|nr:hypothetical protein TNCV_4366651 [Trichonephila clavipes]